MNALTLALSLAAASSGTHKTKIAVLDIQDVSGSEAAHVKLLTQVVVGELPKLGAFEVISSAEIRELLGFERQKQLLGCAEGSCLAELGGALGVDYLVSGQLGRLGKRYRLDLKLLDARKSRVAASAGDFLAANEDDLGDAAISMLRKLLRDGHLAASSAPAKVVGGLSAQAPPTPARTGAFVGAGATALLAAGAVFETFSARSKFDDDRACVRLHGAADPSCAARFSPDTTAHLADALWAGAAVAAGVTAYLFLRTPDAAGSPAEVGVAGRF